MRMRCEMHSAELFQRSAGVAGALLHVKQGNTRIQSERGRAGDAGERRGEARGNPLFQARDSTTAVISVSCSLSLCRCRFPIRARSYKRVPPEILSSDSSHHDTLSCSLLLPVLNRSGCVLTLSQVMQRNRTECRILETRFSYLNYFYFQCEIDFP